MAGGDQTDIEASGPPAGEAPPSRPPSVAPDIEALYQRAVQQIVLHVLAQRASTGLEAAAKDAGATPHTAPEPRPATPDETATVEPPQPATEATTDVAPSVSAGATSVDEPSDRPTADQTLSYVPRDEDRILPEAAEPPAERIEPTFAPRPSPASGLDAQRADAPAAPLAETTAPERGVADIRGLAAPARWWEGPWTWRRAARLAGLAVAAYFAAVLSLILIYRFINPPTTTLIAYQWLTGTKIEQDWVPIENISSNLLRAVVVSEDWGFCHHYGVDLDAIERALEQAGEGKVARGASTISMQVIKNLFLSQSKSYLRKAVEIPLTFVAEAVWPKARMLEIYLNIAEWGPGVFGAEAAARHHFNKPASRLSEREAALLAAALPNPILRDAGDPGTRTARKASVIQSRMRAAGPVADCAMTGRQRAAETPSGSPNRSSSGWQTTVKKRAGADQGL